jgi:hypothetical protein
MGCQGSRRVGALARSRGGLRLHSTFHLHELQDQERFSDAIELHLVELFEFTRTTAPERAEERDPMSFRLP